MAKNLDNHSPFLEHNFINPREQFMLVQIDNLSLAEDIYVPIDARMLIKKMQVTTANAITAASGTVTLTDGDGNTIGAVAVTVAESNAGARFEDSTMDATHGVVVPEEVLKVAVDGASSTVCKATLMISYVRLE